MNAFIQEVSRKLSDAIAGGGKEPEIVEKFTNSIGSCGGQFGATRIQVRSKFIHQRPYAYFVSPPQIEGVGRTELGDVLFVLKEKKNGKVKRRRMAILQVKVEKHGVVEMTPHQHIFQRDLYHVAFRFGKYLFKDVKTWHPNVWSRLAKSKYLMANLVLCTRTPCCMHDSGVVCYASDIDGVAKALKYKLPMIAVLGSSFIDYFDALCSFRRTAGYRITPVLGEMLNIIYKSAPVNWKLDPPEEWEEYFGEQSANDGFGIVEITINRDGVDER